MNTTFILLLIFLLTSCTGDHSRTPASNEGCQDDGKGCNFLIIGHRGAPYIEAENTLKSFQESMYRGGNALEIDVNITRDGHVIVMHDRHPNELIALARQAGLEGLKYIPSVPNIGNSKRTYVEELSLDEIREDYGYAISKGILGDIFFSNEKIEDVVIPTLQEFGEWSKDYKELEAVFVDIKVGEEQEELALEIANQVSQFLLPQHYRIYLMSPHQSIYEVMDRYVKQNNPKGMRALLDLEKSGAMKHINQLFLNRISMGMTPFKSWKKYLKEIEELTTYRFQPGSPPLYPIIAWTIDDDFMLYKLVQEEVDGIITNRPRRLARLIKRHFKDYSMASKMIAACYHDYHDSGDGKWKFCASGKAIEPFAPIELDDLRRWACKEDNVSGIVTDLLGCGAIGDKVEVVFEDELEDNSLSNIWYRPDGKVVVAKAHQDFGDDQIPFILNYKQKRCMDGVLNYNCEYLVQVLYLDPKSNKYESIQVKKKIQDGSFTVFSSAPVGTKKLLVVMTEVDGSEKKSTGKMEISLHDGAKNTISTKDKTFKGEITLQTFDYQSMKLNHAARESFSIDFKQKSCNDGFLNYDCEYRIQVKAVDAYGNELALKNYYKDFDSSFTFFSTMPEKTKELKIRLDEIDGGEIHSSGKAYGEVRIPVKHGSFKKIRSIDSTFKGELVLKMFDYDETRDHSEGINGFTPHNVKNKKVDTDESE